MAGQHVAINSRLNQVGSIFQERIRILKHWLLQREENRKKTGEKPSKKKKQKPSMAPSPGIYMQLSFEEKYLCYNIFPTLKILKSRPPSL
jgi:hypothetical protein